MGRYLDLLKVSENGQTGTLQNLQNPPKPSFVGFVGTSSGGFQENQGAGKPERGAKHDAVTARAWLLHFTDHDPLEVWSAPPATHAEVLADYPDALAAEPMTGHRGRTATEVEAHELRGLIQAVYADDSDADRGEAMQAAMADPEGAMACYRAIAAERGIAIGTHAVRTECAPTTMVSKLVTTESGLFPSCFACRHLRKPGRADGYCGGGRDDLPGAYGPHHPLRRLPGSGGAECNLFEEWA